MTIFFTFLFCIQCARRICNNENISTQMVLNMNNTIVKECWETVVHGLNTDLSSNLLICIIPSNDDFFHFFFVFNYARRICNNENISTQMVLNMNNTILRKCWERVVHGLNTDLSSNFINF